MSSFCDAICDAQCTFTNLGETMEEFKQKCHLAVKSEKFMLLNIVNVFIHNYFRKP